MNESNAAPNALHILHLEDNPLSSERIRAEFELRHLACRITRVWTRDSFENALFHPTMDVIISDLGTPEFDGITALALARQRCPDAPFIFFCDHGSPRIKADAFRQGASDFICKSDPAKLARVIHWLFFLNQEKLHRLARPQTGAAVIVHSPEHRRLGYLDPDGTWRDYHTSEEIPNVIGWSQE